MPVRLLPSETDKGASLWWWALGGAVGGAIIGGTVAANHVSPDAFYPQIAIGFGIGVGALGGAAVGAMTGAIYNGVAYGDDRK